jgi:hypothetical protein
MTKKYRVLFYGLSGDEEDFRSCMAHLGAPPEAVDKMITKAPVILKEGLTSAFSARYADAVRKAGGMVEVQEHGYLEESMNHTISIASFKDFTMCPECGLKQQKRETCVKCGFRLVNMEKGLEPKNVAGN